MTGTQVQAVRVYLKMYFQMARKQIILKLLIKD